VEIYGEMELSRLLDQFFDRALCFATEGYEQYVQLQVTRKRGFVANGNGNMCMALTALNTSMSRRVFSCANDLAFFSTTV